jgi:polyisoprenoid-binding protein YceI
MLIAARNIAALSLGAGLALASLPAAAAPETYAFDRSHTELRFSWDHLGLSRQAGRFLDVEGSLMLDPEKPETSHVEVVIKLASLWTGVKELDQILRGKEFFDVASFPVATFRSSEVKPLSDKTARVTGDLTIAGKTNQVVLEVTWNFSGEHPLSRINPAYTDQYYTGFSVKTQLLRSDWGITRTIPYVSDEILIGIEAEMKRTSGGASAAGGASEAVPAPAR